MSSAKSARIRIEFKKVCFRWRAVTNCYSFRGTLKRHTFRRGLAFEQYCHWADKFGRTRHRDLLLLTEKITAWSAKGAPPEG